MLILASNSPRRRQLLSLGSWPFSVLPAEIDESVHPGEAPDAYVTRLAQSKARAALAVLRQAALPEARGSVPQLIIAADTAVVDWTAGEPGTDENMARGEPTKGSFAILGKPVDFKDAERMLRRLRGRSHWVYTGLAALRLKDDRLLSEVCISEVPMRQYSDEEMLAYIASGDPMDKAGAYAIQHAGFKPVETLQGCYANVMGLPVCHLTRLLAEFGIPAQADVPRSCQQMLGYSCSVYRQILQDGTASET
jgi:septum formation protein